MNTCLTACGCDDLEGITKSDLDRFTDKIENVLSDEKGRKLFKNYLISCKMKDGRRVLEFWENTERLLNYKKDNDGPSFKSYLENIDELVDASERIEELDYGSIRSLLDAREAENEEEIKENLKKLKLQCNKALRREYNKFRFHYIPSKYKYYGKTK